MYYQYVCEDKHETEVDLPMREEHPKRIKCSVCGKEAWRDFGGTTTIIPEHMRASDMSDDNYASATNLRSTFKNARRPSGKKKIYY